MSAEKADYNPSDALLNLKGKAYLPVASRIVWFRNDYPEGQIETTIVSIDEKQAIFRARVATGQGGVAEATGTETPRDFGDYIEKAETKAVGRALGYLGYGTASAGFEEGQRIVDAPQPLNSPKPPRAQNASTTRQNGSGAMEAPNNAPQALNVRASVPCAECPHPSVCRTEGYCWREAAAVANSKRPTRSDDDYLAIVNDDTRVPERRVMAAKHYVAQATDAAGVQERVLRLTSLPLEERDRIRDAALDYLRTKAATPAS